MTAPESSSSACLKGRLLDCALAVFSSVGFRQASIRSICKRCEANVASVNYYFGGKTELYRAVFIYGDGLLSGRKPLAEYSSLHDALSAYYRRVLDPLARGDARALAFFRLINREYLEPTGELDQATSAVMARPHRELTAYVAAQVGRPAEDPSVQLLAMSVAAIAFPVYRQAQRFTSLLPDVTSTPEKQEEVVRYLASAGAALIKSHPHGGGPA
jgi:AcrR family transcriptional regulator